MNPRDAFLQHVRQAVTDGNRPGHVRRIAGAGVAWAIKAAAPIR